MADHEVNLERLRLNLNHYGYCACVEGPRVWVRTRGRGDIVILGNSQGIFLHKDPYRAGIRTFVRARMQCLRSVTRVTKATYSTKIYKLQSTFILDRQDAESRYLEQFFASEW